MAEAAGSSLAVPAIHSKPFRNDWYQNNRFRRGTVWPVIFGMTGPIYARALNLFIRLSYVRSGIMIGQLCRPTGSQRIQ